MLNKELIKELLRKDHRNMEDACEDSGIKYSTLQGWLYQGITPTVDKFERLINGLGYKIEVIKDETDQVQ